MNDFPLSVKASLWSYDTGKLDLEGDKRRIIFNVLNYGTDEAARWAFKTYARADLARTVAETPRSEWSRKSLALWSAVLHAQPARETRFENKS